MTGYLSPSPNTVHLLLLGCKRAGQAGGNEEQHKILILHMGRKGKGLVFEKMLEKVVKTVSWYGLQVR